MRFAGLGLCVLGILACSGSSDEAGIVLNVDVDVIADRAAINTLVVTVDGKRQEWFLSSPLPGSLGIKTSAGNKTVIVEGLSLGKVVGTWSGSIQASKDSVVVKDVHLSCAYCARTDASADLAGDGGRDGFDSGVNVDGVGNVTGDGGVGAGGDGKIVWLDGGAGGSNGFKDGGSANDARAGLTGGSRSGTGGARLGTGGATGGAGGAIVGTGGAPGGTGGTTLTKLSVNGAFSVTSSFEVPASAAAPGPLGDVLGIVHGLATDPGEAILDFAEDAGVPALSTLRAALPDMFEANLVGWMNSYLMNASVGGVNPYRELAKLDSTINSVLLDWVLKSRLDLPVNGSGTHAPVSLSFFSGSSTVVVPLEATASVISGTGVTGAVSWPNGENAAALMTISDHSMGIPFGQYALRGLNGVLLAEYGAANVAAFLSEAVGCSGMADSVSSICIGFLCVGHKADLQAVCEGGLSEAARQIESGILALDFKAIQFMGGTATAVGATPASPQDIWALQDGVWNSTIDLGNGPQAASATFTATR